MNSGYLKYKNTENSHIQPRYSLADRIVGDPLTSQVLSICSQSTQSTQSGIAFICFLETRLSRWQCSSRIVWHRGAFSASRSSSCRLIQRFSTVTCQRVHMLAERLHLTCGEMVRCPVEFVVWASPDFGVRACGFACHDVCLQSIFDRCVRINISRHKLLASCLN